MKNTNSKTKVKDTYKPQLTKVYEAFFEQPRTMKEADFICGVMRESICRYVATLRKQGLIVPIRKRRCTRTNHRAGEYTTNPAYFPKQRVEQPTLDFLQPQP